MLSRPPALSSGRRIRPFVQHAHRIVPSCLHHVLVSLDRTWRVHTTAMHVTGAGSRPSLTTSHVTARSTTFGALGSGRWMRVGSGRIKAKGRVTTSHKKKKNRNKWCLFSQQCALTSAASEDISATPDNSEGRTQRDLQEKAIDKREKSTEKGAERQQEWQAVGENEEGGCERGSEACEEIPSSTNQFATYMPRHYSFYERLHTLTTQPETKARFELTPHNLRGHGDKRVIATPMGRPMKPGIDTGRPSPSCKNTHLFVCLCVWSITSL